MFRYGRLVLERFQRPVPGGFGVGHRLLRGKGLGRDDEKGLGGVEAYDGLGEVGAVDVGDEAEGQAALRIVLQGLIGHDGPEVRAAYADVDYILYGLAGMAFPVPPPHLLRELLHLLQHRVHMRHYVFPVHDDGGVLRGAQGGVQHGAALGEVDLLSGEHGLYLLPQAGGLGEVAEMVHGRRGDAVLGVVEVDPRRFDHEFLASPRVGGEQLAQVQAAYFFVVALEGLPRGQALQGNDISHGFILIC